MIPNEMIRLHAVEPWGCTGFDGGVEAGIAGGGA